MAPQVKAPAILVILQCKLYNLSSVLEISSRVFL